MRKLIIFLILIVFMFSNITSFADWQKNLNDANQELINDKDFRIPQSGYLSNNLNTSIANGDWGGLKSGSSNSDKDIGHAFTYGEPYGYDSSKTPPWRYIGKTGNDDDFTNIYFPHDAWGGGFLEDRAWVVNPWDYNLCSKSNFDAPNLRNSQKYRQQIIKGLEMFYGNVLNGTYSNKDWENYVHILQPPTYSSQGIGKMWHISNGSTWYITVPISKIELTNPKPSPTLTPIPTPPTPPPSTTPPVAPLANPVDFKIYRISPLTNITDDSTTYDIGNSSFGQLHQVRLALSTSISNVASIVWKNLNTQEVTQVLFPSDTATTSVLGYNFPYETEFEMTVFFSDGSFSRKNHTVTVAETGLNTPPPTPTPTPTNTPLPTSTPTPIPSPSPSPLLNPVAVLSCPAVVGKGQEFSFDGNGSYSKTQYPIIEWNFTFYGSTKPETVTINKSNGYAKYLKIPDLNDVTYLRLYVKTIDGNGGFMYSDSVIQNIKVEEPKPYLSFEMPPQTKELRKVTADISKSSTSSPEAYLDIIPPQGHWTDPNGIDWTNSYIQVTKITGASPLASDQLYFEYWDQGNNRQIGQLLGQKISAKKINIMGKKTMEVKVSAQVSDIEGRKTDISEKVLTIDRDAYPIGEIDYPTKGYRTVLNPVTGEMEGHYKVTSTSYSPDGDTLEYENFYYREDRNDDGKFEDETLYQAYPKNSGEHFIDVVWKAPDIWNIEWYVEIKELLPLNLTIPEYIKNDDYKYNIGYLHD